MSQMAAVEAERGALGLGGQMAVGRMMVVSHPGKERRRGYAVMITTLLPPSPGRKALCHPWRPS